MKKVLSTALALGLVAGIATTAAAYDKFEVSGYYTAQGFYVDNAQATNGVDFGAVGVQNRDVHTAFWQQDMRLYPNLTINDKTRMKAEIRLMDTDIWGTTDTTSGPSGGRMADINKLYVEYDSPMGMVRLGRIPFGTYGHSAFDNSAGREDGIVFASNFLPKPFSLTFVTAKLDERDAGTTSTTVTTTTVSGAFATHVHNINSATTTNKLNDADSDWYSIHLDYKTDGVMAGTRLILVDEQGTASQNYEDWRMQAYGKMSMDNLWFGGEVSHKFGERDNDGATADVDDDSWALMLEAGGKFGKLDAGLTYWWISGDNDTDATEDSSYGDAGNDWQPLLVMTHEHMQLLNNKNGNGNYGNAVQNAGANVIMASFGMPVSDKMTVSSKLAYGWADDEATGWDDEYGYEVDLGMSYKLLDNLTYGVNFGYFAAGDFFTKQGNTADVTKEDSVVLLHHSLNMTF